MKKLTTDEFIRKAILIHKNKYDYTLSIYNGSQSPITIICPIHGKFYQKANNHLNGSNCYKCGLYSNPQLQRDTQDDFIKKAVSIHKNRYDYSNISYINSQTKVQIQCNKCLKTFKQIPADHLRGTGCPICNQSKGELKILDFLQQNNIQFIFQKAFNNCRNPITNRKLKYDFYIPSKNILIEFDGKQHFIKICIIGRHFMSDNDLIEVNHRDKIKEEYAKQHGIKLLRIKYTQLNKIEEILKLMVAGT